MRAARDATTAVAGTTLQLGTDDSVKISSTTMNKALTNFRTNRTKEDKLKQIQNTIHYPVGALCCRAAGEHSWAGAEAGGVNRVLVP